MCSFLKMQHQLVVQLKGTTFYHGQYNMIRDSTLKMYQCTFKISLFPDFLQRLKFFLTRSKIPLLFPDLEEIFFSLTSANHV